jgi:hypothetical protein
MSADKDYAAAIRGVQNPGGDTASGNNTHGGAQMNAIAKVEMKFDCVAVG